MENLTLYDFERDLLKTAAKTKKLQNKDARDVIQSVIDKYRTLIWYNEDYRKLTEKNNLDLRKREKAYRTGKVDFLNGFFTLDSISSVKKLVSCTNPEDVTIKVKLKSGEDYNLVADYEWLLGIEL